MTNKLGYDNIVIQCITINYLIMRKVINISLPPQMARTVRKAVKDENYISTSEFFRKLLRDWEKAKLAKELRVSQKEIRAGKGRTLRSLKNLR